ncbi:MAG TPA: succinyl-diaminopimelate desuccinylase [Gammaproteobacteria bacterium]|nr:succinyl-diaminopimelate desuccinylase [Gammaproteobacteria bacterium]
MTDSRTIELTKQLVGRPSLTPHDAGCIDIIGAVLKNLGFTIHLMPFGETSNLWASHGAGAPHFVFLGHTDVVPTGDRALWLHDPFTPTIDDGKLYGRGVADMKGGIAAMLSAMEQFIAQHPKHKGTISFLITSDEEGPALDGTQKVVAKLIDNNVKIDWCLVGEPGSQVSLGDTLKLGARGSLTGTVVFTGKQGHVGHPHKAKNPIHATLNTLHNLTQIKWDEATTEFPASSLQITNMHSGVGAENVIPETLYCQFNIRFAPGVTPQQLKTTIKETLDMQALPYNIDWRQGGEPFVSTQGSLTAACINAIKDVLGKTPVLSNIGGTSDARFMVKTGCEAVELGLLNATIHAVNENAACADLDALTQIYLQVLEQLLGSL